MTLHLNNHGVTLVFVALGLVTFLMFIGLCLDAGWMIYVRSQGQTRVDAAALAAASALKEQDATSRHGGAQTLANTFANSSTGTNIVVDSSVNPENALKPMSYNLSTGELTSADWATANAVQVTNEIPTPLFFSGIRNVFGATENGSTDINVGATAYLGCPTRARPTLPIALCADSIVDFSFPGSCGELVIKNIPSAVDGYFFASGPGCTPGVFSELTIGEELTLNDDQSGTCRAALGANPPSGIVPVVSGSCTPGEERDIVGFAYLRNLSRDETSGIIQGELGCNRVDPSQSGAQCFGVTATIPLLVQ